MSTVEVRTPRPGPRLVGGSLDEARLEALMAGLSADEAGRAALSWAPQGPDGASSRLVRAGVLLGGIGAVVVFLLALMWLVSLFL